MVNRWSILVHEESLHQKQKSAEFHLSFVSFLLAHSERLKPIKVHIIYFFFFFFCSFDRRKKTFSNLWRVLSKKFLSLRISFCIILCTRYTSSVRIQSTLLALFSVIILSYVNCIQHNFFFASICKKKCNYCCFSFSVSLVFTKVTKCIKSSWIVLHGWQ